MNTSDFFGEVLFFSFCLIFWVVRLLAELSGDIGDDFGRIWNSTLSGGRSGLNVFEYRGGCHKR